ncbi:MAG: cytoplasmic protein [Gimesia sp.]|nr:cytoplasmic protein [Gimesia sp.]
MTKDLSSIEIYLAKCRKVILSGGRGGATSAEIATVAKNLQALGYGLSQSVLEQLATLSSQEVTNWYQEILPVLQRMVGAHREFKPMYPNFPRQVMEASHAELYLNALVHYYGFMLSDMLGDPDFVLLPHYERTIRPQLDELHQLRWIELGAEDDFNQLFTRLAASNASLSEMDKEILCWFAANRDVEALIPETIPQKETLAFLAALLPDSQVLIKSIKTATDVLRIAVAMSDGDVSLAEPVHFRNFAKRERRFLLSCLENTGTSRTEDMLRWKDRWIRLGERLHPGDYQKRFPNSFASFSVLRNNLPFKTFNSKIEDAIRSGDADQTTQLLVQRPGDFARRLDHVLRQHANTDQILEAFLSIASQVSTPVLLQAWSHFQHRDSIKSRAFFPKGNAAKVQYDKNELPPLPTAIARTTADQIRRVLIERFSKLPRLNNIYLDPRLEDQIVPFSQRSASRSLRSISRGSRFDLPDGDTVRFFCWWKNIESNDEWGGRVDLDLSASLFDNEWQHNGAIAYYNLKEGECYHSGDITSAPQGACEFIDINLPYVLKRNSRYIVMSVLSYSSQPFFALPECFGGWIMRQKPNSGEIFEAKTVQDKIDITAATRTCVPVIIDAQDRQVYWADLSLKSYNQINNAATNSVGFTQIGRAVVELCKPTLWELFEMHAEARGHIVETRDSAETVFDLYDGTVTAFDTSTILSEYLA